MNEIIKFLFEGDEFMPEMHLSQPEFTYSASGLLKIKKYKNLQKQEIHDIITETN